VRVSEHEMLIRIKGISGTMKINTEIGFISTKDWEKVEKIKFLQSQWRYKSVNKHALHTAL